MAVCNGQTALHTKTGVIIFLKTEILFIWNHSFGSQIRLRMHSRASSTFWLPAAPTPPAVMAVRHPRAPKAYGLGHPMSLKYTILTSIKDSGQVYFLSLLILPHSVKKKLSPQNLQKRKNLSPEIKIIIVP